MKTLKQATVGETVKVVKLHGEGAIKRRIMDMGLTKGDGGLLTTNSESLKDRAIALRNHGGAVRYHHYEIAII